MKLLSGNKTIGALGLMSGTSLDGLDIAAVEFRQENGQWSFELKDAATAAYSEEWEKQLREAPALSGERLTRLDFDYGQYLGEQVNRFLENRNFSPDFIASHGHTVFHRPERGYTLQIGCGAKIAATTRLLTVADFRTADLAWGGQGAPLVPIGDKLLFSGYDYCLNLGGFANISFERNQQRMAFDICPANIVLNAMAQHFGLKYDKNGALGRQGTIDTELLNRLNELEFYQISEPKSLGREWLEACFLPLIVQSSASEQDKLRTVYEHIATQIARSVSGTGKMLITGGGAFNGFLIERIQQLSTTAVCLPAPEIINYKEAIVFAFLGLLRLLEADNCLASVTGAAKNHSSGIIFRP